MMKNIVLGFLVLFSFSIEAQDSTEISIITNRPGLTEASRAVYKSGLQIESGFQFSRIPYTQGNQFHTDYLLLPNLGLLYGVSNNVEIRVFTTVVGSQNNWGTDSGGYTFKIPETFIGTKVNLVKGKGWVPEMAFLFSQGIPTNFNSDIKRWPTSLLLAWGYSLPSNLSISGNFGYVLGNKYESQNLSHTQNMSYTLNVNYGFTNNFGVFAEFYGISQFNSANKFGTNIDAGLWYRINNKFQIDASSGYGFNLGDYFVNAGFSLLLMK